MSINLPMQPPYTVDFQKYEDLKTVNSSSLMMNIGTICKVSLMFFYTVGRVFCEATWETIKNSPSSFRHTVLGYNDFNIARGIFRIVHWVIGLGMHWVSSFFNGLASEYQPSQNFQLEGLAAPGLDISHIASAETDLDASSVPTEIQVRALLDAFDQINFTDPNQPGYFTENARKIDGRVYSVEELRKNLKTFIDNVENKKAFFGTPPEYDIEKLFTYYQFIEDATRLTLEKVLSDINQFEDNHPDFVKRFKGEPIFADEDEPLLAKEYQDLLENRSRLALDFAFTGEHCGGRYTGDVAVAYNFHCKQNGVTDLSLREQLHSLLAHKRREIADSYIASLPTHAFGQSHNTHTYSEYMQKLGGILGLPGTGNIIEHLSSSTINKNAALDSFFSEYSEDYIIEAVQQKFRDSERFRETVYEWLKSNASEWKKDENTQEAEQITSIIQSIKSNSESNLKTEDINDIKHLNEILEHLRKENVAIPKEIPVGSNFIEEMFGLEETQAKVNELFKGADPTDENFLLKKMQFKIGLMSKMKMFASGINGWTPINVEAAKLKLMRNAKIQEVKKHIQFGENADEVIDRMIEGTSDISQIVTERLRQIREAEFLVAIMEQIMSSHENELNVGLKAIVERDSKAYDVNKELEPAKILNKLVGLLDGSSEQIPPSELHGKELIQWLFEKENIKSCLGEIASERTAELVNGTKALFPKDRVKDLYLSLVILGSTIRADYAELIQLIQTSAISFPEDRDLLNTWVDLLNKCDADNVTILDPEIFNSNFSGVFNFNSEFMLDIISKSSDFKNFISSYYTDKIKEELELAFPGFNEIKKVDTDSFSNQLVRSKKIQQISDLLHVNDEEAQFLLDNGHTISEKVEEKKDEFISTHGLSKEILEWMLVKHGIFKPQMPASKDEENRSLSPEELSFKNVILNKSDGQQKSKRYVEENSLISLQRVFDKAFEKNPEEIIRATESTSGAYPLWKRAILIEMPRTASKICNSMKFRFVLSFGGGVIFYISSRKAMQILSEVVVSRGYPVLVKHTPELCCRVIKPVLSFYNWGQAHPFKYFAYLLTVYAVLKSINFQPAVNLLGRARHVLIGIPLNLTVLFTIEQTFKTIWALNYSALAAGRFFNDISEWGLKDRKNHMRAYFVTIAK